MSKFYINGPRTKGDGVYSLIHESGESLASHLCSHLGFAAGDLIMQRPERQEEWTKRFGPLEPIELVWLDDVPKAEQDELVARNHALHELYLAEHPEEAAPDA